MGAGAAGNDGKQDGKWGHNRDRNAEGPEPLLRGKVLGQRCSQQPGRAHSTQSPPPAILTPGSSRSYFKFRVQSRGKVALRPRPSCAWQHWDNSRLSSLCSGEMPALALWISSAPSTDGSSSFAGFGTWLSKEQGFADPPTELGTDRTAAAPHSDAKSPGGAGGLQDSWM